MVQFFFVFFGKMFLQTVNGNNILNIEGENTS